MIAGGYFLEAGLGEKAAGDVCGVGTLGNDECDDEARKINQTES